MPNKIQLIDDDYRFHIQEAEIWKVKLIDEKSVEAIKCPVFNADCSFDGSSSMPTVLSQDENKSNNQ